MAYAYLIVLVFLFAFEICYFKIANHFDIIDRPNHRSSHSTITIRGGGIIFPVALLICSLFYNLRYPCFLSGLLFISFISFWDDVRSLTGRIRISIHFLSAALMLWQLNLFSAPFYVIFLALFIIIGVINAVNFMDGINGITGIYSIVTLITLYYLNLHLYFTYSNYLWVSVLAIGVFNFFNCRKTAKCFAGDVGAISVAYVVIFFILQLVIKTGNICYFLLLLVYGLDTATTIIFRIFRKEKLTIAHRSHFYQFLANEKKIPQLYVSLLYGVAQLLINIAIIKTGYLTMLNFALILIISTLGFIIIRFFTEGKKRLMIGI